MEKSINGYLFREAKQEDFARIENLFARQQIRPGWAKWKYRESPDGRAHVFVAEHRNGDIGATLAYLPRRYSVGDGKVVKVLRVVDIYGAPELRTKGVFLGLLDYSGKHISGPRIGSPNDKSIVFGSRLGWKILGPYENWYFPLVIGERFAEKRFALMAPIANVFSKVYALMWLGPASPRLGIRLIERFSEDYALDTGAIHGVRSSDYLNWRFVDNPVNNFSIYEFLDEEKPIGYCVLKVVESAAKIYDFNVTYDRRRCFRLLVDSCRQEAIVSIHFEGLGLRLGSLGYVRLRSKRVSTQCEAPEGRWFITECDSDSEPGSSLADSSENP